MYSEKQNVSSDMIRCPAAVVIEGMKTIQGLVLSIDEETLKQFGIGTGKDINIPVTHAKILGWYDNEFGCYVNCLGKLTKYIYKNMI